MGTANIVPGYVGSGVGVRDQSPLFMQSGAGENLTTSNGAAATSNVTAPAAVAGREPAFRVMLSEEGYVRNDGNTAAVGTAMRCVADTEYYFSALPGDTLSIIDTA